MYSMPTENDWEQVPSVSEQTVLSTPIKIRWQSEDRTRVRRSARAAVEDNYEEIAVLHRVFTRQKTQIVIKTKEELDALKTELGRGGIKDHVRERVEDEIQEQQSTEDHQLSNEDVSEEIKERVNSTDLDRLMKQEIIPHAEKWVNKVWGTDTVDLSDISFFWNPQLTECAGRAYDSYSVPRSMTSGKYAIGLAPDYYYQNGLSALLEIVRHELIHIWQIIHPNGDSGHGPTFRQWVPEMDTSRYCQDWNRVGYGDLVE